MTNQITKVEDVIWRQIEDETVVITADGLSLHVLNPTAAFIWELCDGTKGAEEIVSILCEHFDVSPEEACPDVNDVIVKLEGLGLVKRI